MGNHRDGIWDDGEWLSWDWINSQIADRELQKQYPEADVDVVRVFHELIDLARDYFDITGRYLQIWGELGELYGEIEYGLKRHAPGTAGSDGRMGDDWIEVKTISPEKAKDSVQVKRAGNFNKLLVVRITKDFEFESKLIDRKTLGKGKGKHARLSWGKDEQ
jgi:hypothetical protein